MKSDTVKPCMVTELDPATGKMTPMEAPQFGQPGSEEFWKTMIEGVRRIVRSRGCDDRFLLLGEAFDSRPRDGTARRAGAFLVQSAFQGNLITSAMFLTAMAANPLAAQMAADKGIEITWAGWAYAALVPGLVSLLVVPFVLYRLYPPEIRRTPSAPDLARAKLAEMGAMKRDEWIMLGTFLLLLTLWIFGKRLHVHSTVAVIVGLGVLLTSRVLKPPPLSAIRAVCSSLP